jgi:hypothetical protein
LAESVGVEMDSWHDGATARKVPRMVPIEQTFGLSINVLSRKQ